MNPLWCTPDVRKHQGHRPYPLGPLPRDPPWVYPSGLFGRIYMLNDVKSVGAFLAHGKPLLEFSIYDPRRDRKGLKISRYALVAGKGVLSLFKRDLTDVTAGFNVVIDIHQHDMGEDMSDIANGVAGGDVENQRKKHSEVCFLPRLDTG